ncbi:hypothetical protein C8D88_111264 [Lentzea atacamensis]|uniref:Uncharacterized protein n=1 Tax=Lentzea atacamensis TaxID=531938 RepID=A0A316HTX1_9PSEU|nr:hypothetical protein C8D88_111264 [Lentzea atacamensis]
MRRPNRPECLVYVHAVTFSTPAWRALINWL